MAVPKMTIDTLLMAARFLEEQDKQEKLTASPPTAALPSPTTSELHLVPHVLPPTPPIQHHVTIQHATPPATNGHTNNITLTAQQVNTIRINKKEVSVSPTQPQTPSVNRLSVMNSFDLINPPVFDHGSGEVKRKPPPMAFRTGTREVHNKLEKNRRAHLKECFDILYAQLPNSKENKKTSNLNILGSALKYIRSLEAAAAAGDAQRDALAKEKSALQARIVALRKEIMAKYKVDVSLLMPDLEQPRSNVLKLPKSITTNGVRQVRVEEDEEEEDAVEEEEGIEDDEEEEEVMEEITTAMPTTTVLPPPTTTTTTATATFGYHAGVQQNGGLVLQKVIAMPKSIAADLHAQFAPGQVTHFIATATPAAAVDGKVLPTIVNAQYVVKPLVVVSTPSRPS